MVSSKTTRPIELKFLTKSPNDKLAKIYTSCTGHMTKMASTPIYNKNPKIYFSLEPKSQWPWDLVCSIGDVSSTRFAQIMNLG